MGADALLQRLDGVRRTADRRWLARCPAHDDKRPSLTIREADDGRTLVCCFGGCQTADILAAVGLSWADLFPPRSRTDPPSRRRREPLVSASDALRVLAHEVTVCALVAGDLANGRGISETDRARLLTAANRIAKVEALCG
jgi:hypothetical protein